MPASNSEEEEEDDDDMYCDSFEERDFEANSSELQGSCTSDFCVLQ